MCYSLYKCILEAQGYEPCKHLINVGGKFKRPCEAGFWIDRGVIKRLIFDTVLSRPEDYLSVYQSCCNHNCLKCHSWYFSQVQRGRWYAPEQVLDDALKYEDIVTIWEPRERATMWHASDLCSHCGSCKIYGEYGPFCPKNLNKDQVLLSPQGYGPARNIISFTGGDLYCYPAFYVKTFRLLKKESNLWIHIETNGYGLTTKNLEELYSAGLDSIWLDLKAFDENVYKELCGTTNRWILELPAKILDMGIILEIVLLYIPGYVQHDEIERFATLLSSVDKDIPITLLAFFPEYMMSGFKVPTYDEMVKAFNILNNMGLRRVRLGNINVFCGSEDEIYKLIEDVGMEHLGL